MPNTEQTASTSSAKSDRDDDASAAARGTAKVQQAADQIRSSATERVESVWKAVDSAKSRAADRVHKLSNAVRKIGEHMRIEDQSYIAERANDASRRLDAAADYIAEADLSTLRRDAEQVARQRPGLVFGGTFLLGLAAGRLFKAVTPEDGADGSDELLARPGIGSESAQPRRRVIQPSTPTSSTSSPARRSGESTGTADDLGARR